ncbi:SMAD/FHA domain-containing protein isoform X2 [Tasmannia lanceolata]|uniref:SMAD/FHA domain-containing protein isoform X2 n=1 Tax=Tasmannia lanceolata TaxID=3420 RepID=UPI004062EE11
MALDDPVEQENPQIPLAPKPALSPEEEIQVRFQTDSPLPRQPQNSQSKPILTTKDFLLSVVQKITAQPLKDSDPGVWGVLTAISQNARMRPQGINILLNGDEHCLGRLAEGAHYRIEAPAVSAKHCKIYKKTLADEDMDQTSNIATVFLKDTSTNGTYLNWEKLKKKSPEAQIQHGDIISFVAQPHHESAIAFVYREVCKSLCSENNTLSKRKTEEFGPQSKRLKGLGIGAPDGPISLDDVRSLQRSNSELRKQLESHVHTIETIRNETRVAVARHENELKQLKESVTESYLNQIKELNHMLEVKQKELDEVSTLSVERQHTVEDLNERLAASMQSRSDADEIINSQKATISELEARLEEERNQRKEEREKAVADLKAALQRAQLEAQEEIKRQSDAALRQQREQQEVISKLQESDKEGRVLVETLRSKLEDTRDSFVTSEKKVRQLEAQLREEQLASANERKRAKATELQIKRLREELESEKVAREEAWAKVSALELEMAAAIRDLSVEKQRFQGARERIILRETQLRAFYSTTEEITALFTKQQEQLKAMQKTLEDEENYENTSLDIDLQVMKENINGVLVREREEAHRSNNTAREASEASTPKNAKVVTDSTSDDDASTTEKHDCNLRSQEGGQTQDAECTSPDGSVKGFGSDICGVGTAPLLEGQGEPIETERVLETESEAIDIGFMEQHTVLHKCSNLAGDTMQVDDDDAQVKENDELNQRNENPDGRCSQSDNQREVLKTMEDTEPGTIRTSDLLASEPVGSWAVSTAPSVHGENESPRSGGHASDDEAQAVAGLICCSDGQAAGSQNVPSVVATAKFNQDRLALNAMIDIVAPDFKEQFHEEGSGDESESLGDADTEVSDHGDGDNKEDAAKEEDEDVVMEDDDDDDTTEDDSCG